MRDVHDVEHTEGNRNPGCNGGVEPAEQKPRDNRVHQQIEGNIHPRSKPARRRFALPDSSPERCAAAISYRIAGVTPL
jgi:hypothetical protein